LDALSQKLYYNCHLFIRPQIEKYFLGGKQEYDDVEKGH